MSRWTSQDEYEAIHGTQEEQAKKQVVATADADGPYRLVRSMGRVVLPNSVRSTRAEAERLREDELNRTGLQWAILPFTREDLA